jgi:flagellar assembly factor FliW
MVTQIIDQTVPSYDIKGEIIPIEYGEDNIAIINSRFGELRLDKTKILHFPKGILGVSSRNFILTNYPQEAFQQYKILQSAEDARLAFIVLPVPRDENNYFSLFYQHKDIDDCLKQLAFNLEDIEILLILSIHNTEVNRMSLNLKAPIILNTKENIGLQYVFTNNNYEIRHFIK